MVTTTTSTLPSRYPVIALENLGLMTVLEQIDTETILSARMLRFVALWAANDPPAAAQYDVASLEFDPIKITEEAQTYFELMVRDRVNQAARAVTLAFATGSDLDAIASRYPGGVPRQVGETDDRYRRRIWLSPNLLSPHGTLEAYQFWTFGADPTVRDVSAETVPGTGRIIVTAMIEGADPRPTLTQQDVILEYLISQSRKGLTDVISVQAPQITHTKYKIRVWLFPGPDQTSAMASLRTAVLALVERQRWLGFDHMRFAIDGVLAQTGVHHAVIDEPAIDLIVPPSGLVQVSDVELSFMGRAE